MSSRTGITLRLAWIVCFSLVILSMSLAACRGGTNSGETFMIKIEAGVTGSIGDQPELSQ
jgi:hypothetical protein